MSRGSKLSIKQKQTLQSVGVVLIVIAGVLLTTSNNSFVNDHLMKINDDEVFYIGTHFENEREGDYVNEGMIVFEGDINNEGKFDCGDCTSGATYIQNNLGDIQAISGTQVVRMHDVVVDNEAGVDLEVEWQIRNSLDFVNGMIRSDRNLGRNVFIHFEEDAIVDNASADRHIDGYAAKSGGGKFVLPTGDGIRLMPVQINGIASYSFFKAAYYNSDPNNGAMLPGGPFFTLDYDLFEITHVSSKEFWDIDGNTATNITLPWDEMSDIASWTPSIDSVIVVGWNGEEWESLGQISVAGNMTEGSVTSEEVIPDEYQAYALGKMTPGYRPVDYLTFDAVQKGDDGYLFWTTTREINTFYFDVERSLDAIIFEKFGQVQAGGNTDTVHYYDFWDEGVALRDLDRIFYRIRQVDLDGTFIYSQVEELVFGIEEEEIDLTIYPNPVVDILKVRYVAREALQAKLRIYNMLGQNVHEIAIAGSGELSIDVSHLAVGHYVVTGGNDEIQTTKRLIVTR